MERDNYKNDKEEGLWREYRTDGSLELEVEYNAGEFHGIMTKYDEEEKIRHQHRYENGKRVETYWLRGVRVKDGP